MDTSKFKGHTPGPWEMAVREAYAERIRRLEVENERLERLIETYKDGVKQINRDRIALLAENERLRDALEMVDKWDLQWADGLDANVARVKAAVRAALKGDE